MNKLEDIKNIWDIYKTGFPACEQRKFSSYEAILQENPEFNPDILYYNGTPSGILFHWDTKDFSYLEHFAIKKGLRNQGIGGCALDEFLQKHSRVVLEVDPPEDDICRRRIQFYQRHGLHYTGFSFTHPGYPENRSSYTLYLMTKPAWTESECNHFLNFLFARVLKAQR